MYPSVVGAFALALKGEGLVPYIYLDKESLLTTGRGNLIDSSVKGYTDPAALSWVNVADGSPATPSDLAADLAAVKARPDLIPYGTSPGPNGDSFGSITKLRLTDDSIASLVASAAAKLWASLKLYLPAIESWPADGQLGLLRWAWGNGPNVPFKAPRMYAALGGGSPGVLSAGPDFRAAAKEAHWLNENADTAALIPQLFYNAADVVDHGLDVATLVWPNNVVQGTDGIVAINDSDFSGEPADFSDMLSAGCDCDPSAGPYVDGPSMSADPGGILGGHSLLDVASLKREYDKLISSLRLRFDTISARWAGLDPARESAFAVDLRGLESRWASAVAAIRADPGVAAELARELNVISQHRILRDADGAFDPGTVPAEAAYQTLIGAIRQGAQGGGNSNADLMPGDYFDLRTRLSDGQKALGLPAVDTLADVPYAPADQDTDAEGREKEREAANWLKLVLAAVTAGLIVNAAVTSGIVTRAIEASRKGRAA